MTPESPSRPPGERLRRVGIAAWSIIGIVILGAFLLWALVKIKIIFPPLVFAILIIYLLNPVVNWLEGKGIPRVAGAMGAYVFVLGGLSLVVILLVPLVSEQVSSVGEDWPHYRTQILSFVEDAASGVENRFGTEIDTAQVSCLLGADEDLGEDAVSQARCDEVTHDLRDAVVAQAGRITEIGSSVLEALVVFILAPLIALYLLIDLPRLRKDLIALVPPDHREEFSQLSTKVGLAIGGFFRGQLLVAIIVGALSALGFKIIGLPFWFLIGSIAGFFNLIPLIGPYIGGALGFLVGTISQDLSLGLKAALVELIVQQIDNHVISPNIMKRAVHLHPVTVMLSLLAGGALVGFWGVLLGVPAVAVVKLLVSHLWTTRVLGMPASPVPEAHQDERESEKVPTGKPERASPPPRAEEASDESHV